jgi:hypothetical protein
MILPIPKTANAAGYGESRPITMMEVLTKCLTNVLSERFSRLAEENSRMQRVFSSAQYAFQKGKGCFHPGVALRCALEDAVQFGKELHLFDGDIAKAYDSVEPWSLQMSYNALGLPQGFRQLMHSMDTHAVSTVLTPLGPSPPFKVERGVRQGDPLSCWRWVIFMDPLLQLIEDCSDGYRLEPVPGCEQYAVQLKVLAYADDTLLFASSQAELQRMVNLFTSFLTWHAVTLNVAKSHYIATTSYRNVMGPQRGPKRRRTEADGPPARRPSGRRSGSTPRPAPPRPPDLTVNSGDRGPVALPVMNSSPVVRYLGFYFTMGEASDTGFGHLRAIIDAWGPRLRRARVSYEEARYLFNRVLVPRMAYPLMVMEPTSHQWKKLGSCLKTAILPKLRLPQTSINEGVFSDTLGLGLIDIRDWTLRTRTCMLYNLMQSGDPVIPLVTSRLYATQRRLLLPNPPLFTSVPIPDVSLPGHFRYWHRLAEYVERMGLVFHPIPDTNLQIYTVPSLHSGDTPLCTLIDIEKGRTLRKLSAFCPSQGGVQLGAHLAWLSQFTGMAQGSALPEWLVLAKLWRGEGKGKRQDPFWLANLRAKVTMPGGRSLRQPLRMSTRRNELITATALRGQLRPDSTWLTIDLDGETRLFVVHTAEIQIQHTTKGREQVLEGWLSNPVRPDSRRQTAYCCSAAPHTTLASLDALFEGTGTVHITRHQEGLNITIEDPAWPLEALRCKAEASLVLPLSQRKWGGWRWESELLPVEHRGGGRSIPTLGLERYPLQSPLPMEEAEVASDGSHDPTTGKTTWAVVCPNLMPTRRVSQHEVWVVSPPPRERVGELHAPVYYAESKAAYWAL